MPRHARPRDMRTSVRNVRTEASAMPGDLGVAARRPRPAARRGPRPPTSGSVVGGQREHGHVGGDARVPRWPPSGSAATRSIRSPTRSRPTTPASGMPHRDRRQAGVARGQRRSDQAYVGQRLAARAAAPRGCARAASATQPVGHRAGREPRPCVRSAPAEHGAGGQVARGDQHGPRRAGGARDRVQPRGDRERRSAARRAGARRASTARRTGAGRRAATGASGRRMPRR